MGGFWHVQKVLSYWGECDGMRKCGFYFLASLGCLESLSTVLEIPLKVGALLFSSNIAEGKGKVLSVFERKTA